MATENKALKEIDKFVEKKAVDLLDEQKRNATMSYAEQAKDIVGAVATQNAVSDEQLVKDITDRKKAELLNNADAKLKQEEAENKKAEIALQEANYGVYVGVANYAGIKKPLPKRMQSVLFTILSALQMLYLIIFGVPISIINITADGIDSVVKKLGTLTKSAMWIVIGVIAIGFVVFLVYVGKFFLAKFGVI